MNWKQIVSDLTDAGHTQIELADKCGCSQPTISAIATGETKDPKGSIAMVLADLHRKLPPKIGRRRAAGSARGQVEA